MIRTFTNDHSWARVDLSLGIPATISPSIPHSFFPLRILKNPLSPQSSFQELATNQYGVPFSTPQPTILMAWPPKALPLTWWQTPLLQVRKSLQTVKAASTGPWVMISVWIFSTFEATPQTLSANHLSPLQSAPLTHVDWHLGVGWEAPHGWYLPVVWWSQGAKWQGWQFLVSLQSHPVTIPVLLNQFQAPDGYPPLHPFPQVAPQQVNKSSDEILVWRVWLLAMQILSLMASTAPKAQHDPQVDWSLTSLMDSHLGHWVAEKNSVGMSLRGSISLMGSLCSLGVGRMVPMRFLISSMVLPSKYLLCPAVQLFWAWLTSWTISAWLRKMFLLVARAMRAISKIAFIFGKLFLQKI